MTCIKRFLNLVKVAINIRGGGVGGRKASKECVQPLKACRLIPKAIYGSNNKSKPLVNTT